MRQLKHRLRLQRPDCRAIDPRAVDAGPGLLQGRGDRGRLQGADRPHREGRHQRLAGEGSPKDGTDHGGILEVAAGRLASGGRARIESKT